MEERRGMGASTIPTNANSVIINFSRMYNCTLLITQTQADDLNNFNMYDLNNFNMYFTIFMFFKALA